MSNHERPTLTDEKRMLLRMRDTLYEGSWDDFARDLESRASGQRHVFETVPTSPAMKNTIAHHLLLISEMAGWEERVGETLSPDAD